jgi:hypothetical protein
LGRYHFVTHINSKQKLCPGVQMNVAGAPSFAVRGSATFYLNTLLTMLPLASGTSPALLPFLIEVLHADLSIVIPFLIEVHEPPPPSPPYSSGLSLALSPPQHCRHLLRRTAQLGWFHQQACSLRLPTSTCLVTTSLCPPVPLSHIV